jgi:hypothetical protein
VISFGTRHIWADFTADRGRVRQILEHDITSGSPSPRLAQSTDSVLARISDDAQSETDSIEKVLEHWANHWNRCRGQRRSTGHSPRWTIAFGSYGPDGFDAQGA